LQDGRLKFVNDHNIALARLLDDPRRGQLAFRYPVDAIVPRTFFWAFQVFVLEWDVFLCRTADDSHKKTTQLTDSVCRTAT
jgi:hypothetical protein